MSVLEIRPGAVVSGAVSLSMAQFFKVTASSGNPAYLVLTALDRNEYTQAASSATGNFRGGAAVLNFAPLGGDATGCGIVFTWQAATGQYVNATYGALNQLVYKASASPADITNISLFGTGSSATALLDAGNPYAMMQADAGGYIGSVTIATQPGFAGSVPAAATPAGIAAAAMKFVGQAWNESGCWVLASTIAAEAGASLPLQSTAVFLPGQPNGEWTVLYNGPAGAAGNWQNLVSTGDIVVFAPPGGGGHITTCVSGAGASAMLVDNITYQNAAGTITNLAHDGSPADVLIAPAHPAMQEWSGVAASSVVIYALDTPVVTAISTAPGLDAGQGEALSQLLAATPLHSCMAG